MGTVEQLEVLLLLLRSSDHYSDATAIAGQLGLRREDAASALEMLAGQNLLDVRLGETIKYRFAPATAGQREAIRQLGELWRDQRGLVVLQVTAKQRALRDFSKAFRLRGSEDDGG